MTRIGDWIQTFSGVAFYPCDPRPDEINIEDIAHALAMLCRFGGHCGRFYSVAEHSVSVSRLVPPEYALCGLLHDATEAYCVDVPRPLKRELGDTYRAIESLIWRAVAAKFHLAPVLPECVKQADNAMLLAEARALMCAPPVPWSIPGRAADVPVIGVAPQFAKSQFLARFAELQR